MAICPECGSSNTKSAGASGFQFVSSRALDCQAVWTPPCPKWAPVVSVLLGLPIALLGLWFVGAMALSLVWNSFSMPGLVKLVVSLVVLRVGGRMMLYGIGTFHGTHGQLQILTPGNKSDSQ